MEGKLPPDRTLHSLQKKFSDHTVIILTHYRLRLELATSKLVLFMTGFATYTANVKFEDEAESNYGSWMEEHKPRQTSINKLSKLYQSRNHF